MANPSFSVKFILHIHTDIGWGGADPEVSLYRMLPRVPVKGDTLSIGNWSEEIDEVVYRFDSPDDPHCGIICYLASDKTVNDESWARAMFNAHLPELQPFINAKVDEYLALGFTIEDKGIYQTRAEREPVAEWRERGGGE